jgi:hypothetical protein
MHRDTNEIRNQGSSRLGIATLILLLLHAHHQVLLEMPSAFFCSVELLSGLSIAANYGARFHCV